MWGRASWGRDVGGAMDIFTGKAAVVILMSVLIAAPATIVLLRRFRTSVVRGMRVQGGSSEDAPPPEVAPLVRVEASEARPTVERTNRSLSRTALVYVIAGLFFAFTFVAVDVIQFANGSPMALMYMLSGYIMPVLFAIWIVLPKGRTRFVYSLVWLGVSLLLLVVPVAVNDLGMLFEAVSSYLKISGSAAVLLLLFMYRRVRAVGPLVLTIAGGAMVGINMVFDALEANFYVWSFFAGIEHALGNVTNIVLIVVLGGIVGALAIGPVLRGVGELHERKHLSDQSLAVDVVFLWFAAAYGLWAAPDAGAFALAVGVAFVLYKVAAFVGFRLLARAEKGGPSTDILLLRPFSLGRRSELLFDHLSKVWLRIGAIHMIAGPDLVTATVTPSEFLVFLSGRLSRRFIHNAEALREHLEGLDLAPDPDGRHRVNQLFCHDDVWRGAMRGLAVRSSVVLMDLRGFTSANKGCVYELGELIRDIPLERIIFAVDATTDNAYLEGAVDGIREQMPASSPNASISGIASRLVSVDNSEQGRTELLRALMKGVPA